MKYRKLLSLVLALLLLCGCTATSNSVQGWVDFYYLKNDLNLDKDNSMIVPESVDIGEQSNDLKAALELYLQGPQSGYLYSPFPDDIKLIAVQKIEGRVEITMNARLASLTGIELTLACCCLAKTCTSISGIEEIRIFSQDRLLDGDPYIHINTAKLQLFSGAH